jgi:hypothetical protein
VTTSLPARNSKIGFLLVSARFVAGYLVAVALGAILFVLTTAVLFSWGAMPQAGALMANAALEYFMFGAVLGIPYAVVGTIAFRFWLPRTQTVFLLLGMFCPASAALLLMAFGGGLRWIDWQFFVILALTTPAGLAAAYVYGAIGMGYGFGRWRFE